MNNLLTWAKRLSRWFPIQRIEVEQVRFDPQLLQNPEISGKEYQEGTLAGWEARAYLLLKYEYRCVYCGKQDGLFELDHVIPRSRGGSNRISNLALCCHDCNARKGNLTAAEWGHPEVEAAAKVPLKDAAVVNATRYKVVEVLQELGLPIGTWSGGRTRWNRDRCGIEKTHALDALCVGDLAGVKPGKLKTLVIKASGRGQHCRTLWTRYGFPRAPLPRQKRVAGFSTGDRVQAVVPAPLKTAGTHVGRVSVRSTGSCAVRTSTGTVDGINVRYLRLIQRGDGYEYLSTEPGGDRFSPSPPSPKGAPAASPVFNLGGLRRRNSMKTLAPFAILNEEDGSSSIYLAFSPKGLLAAQNSRVEIWDLCGGGRARRKSLREPVATFPGGYIRPRSMSWSPDGQQLAIGHERNVVIWDVARREQIALHQHDGDVLALAWSPDGRHIASCSGYGQMHLWSPATGAVVRSDHFGLPPMVVAWSPDSRYLAMNPMGESGRHWQVQLWEVETWSVRQVIEEGAGERIDYSCGAFSPDGQELALGTEVGHVQLWTRDEGGSFTRRLTFSFHQDQIVGIAWSPEGNSLLSGAQDQHVVVWEPGGGAILLHTGCRGEANRVEDVAWWQDLIAVCDHYGHIALYRAPLGGRA